VETPDELAGAWGVRPLLSRRETLPSPFDDLLDLNAADELLSGRGLRTPFVRVVRDGTMVDASGWTAGGGVGAEIADQVDEAALSRLFADGATVVLQALHRTWPPIVDFAGSLTLELGHPVQVNAYVTPPASQGFAAHYDVHDVFVLQFAGEKRWIVHEPVFDVPLRSQPWTQHRAEVLAATAREPALDVVLREGDALYLPRGWVHSAEAEEHVSGHLTVGIHVATRQALAQALLDSALDDVELRRALGLGVDLTDAASLIDHLDAVVEALTRAAAEHPERAADVLRRRVWGSSRPGGLAPLVQAAATAEPSLVVRLRPGLRVALAEDGLLLPDRTLPVDAGATSALEALLDRDTHVLADLPGDPDAVLATAEQLLRAGVIVPAA
jgi:hypothetical protein